MEQRPYGVHKVSEDILRENRGIIFTNQNLAEIDYNRVPVGSLWISTRTGELWGKLAGSDAWSKLPIYDGIESKATSCKRLDIEIEPWGIYQYPMKNIGSVRHYVKALVLDEEDGSRTKGKYVGGHSLVTVASDEYTLYIYNDTDKRLKCKLLFIYDVIDVSQFENTLTRLSMSTESSARIARDMERDASSLRGEVTSLQKRIEVLGLENEFFKRQLQSYKDTLDKYSTKLIADVITARKQEFTLAPNAVYEYTVAGIDPLAHQVHVLAKDVNESSLTTDKYMDAEGLVTIARDRNSIFIRNDTRQELKLMLLVL